jgi:predicted GIY-YIG superfamily endonuclease
MPEGSYSVYVLQNPQGQFYIGLSDDVTKRLTQHNSKVSTWTRYRGPWQLVWTSQSQSLSMACKLEKILKRQKGGNGFTESQV